MLGCTLLSNHHAALDIPLTIVHSYTTIHPVARGPAPAEIFAEIIANTHDEQ